jgi:hypothetical protein
MKLHRHCEVNGCQYYALGGGDECGHECDKLMGDWDDDEPAMRYSDIEPMCRPIGGVRGCPHDGLGCVGGNTCWINSTNPTLQSRAWQAKTYDDFYCVKRITAILKATGGES